MAHSAARDLLPFLNAVDSDATNSRAEDRKSAMNTKGKRRQKPTYKMTPGKMKRKSFPKTPGAINKKKGVIYNSTKRMKVVHGVKTHNVYSQVKSPNKENRPGMSNEYPAEQREVKCPSESSNTSDNFNSEELYKMNSNLMQLPETHNVLKPSSMNHLANIVTGILKNPTFSRLKSAPAKAEKLEKGPSIRMNCETDFDDSLKMKYENKKNPTQSTSSTKSLTVDSHCTKTPNLQNKKIPNTSSPNVYSQSLTVDPFLSFTYFYDEEAVDNFEEESKRWLNYILLPPLGLESNLEQKIDKKVPLATTKEQACNNYYNSHRLASLRRAAKALLMSPEITQVLQKLGAYIDMKQIAIRTDRNLHLDLGLQKIALKILLSYNPLWLRIGLEAIYNTILPLKSNNDISGLTTFIIHCMFTNPQLKNKSKLHAPNNMLLSAFKDPIKTFTVKQFFVLVFFLDQAKQKKLIPHDPCLYCRNAICKNSRDIIISFTRELIGGIGDITRLLRPLGYVVSHKQSYLDEYKYAVHNIAVDIRDGVRLTKVMEIILSKNGLMNQLRTPALSRLQRIHNVKVALSALEEADFAITGNITAIDIADGNRLKTLSLLWQLIHVFRASLFVTASSEREMQKVTTATN